MKNHLFLFTIGPVQSYIESARKAQDLYAGSQILSDLATVAMKEFKKQFPEGTILFPHKDGSSNGGSIPNRFIGEVNGSTGDLQSKGTAIKNAVTAVFNHMALDAIDKANANTDVKVTPKGYLEQVEAHLDIHWVFEPRTSDYKASYSSLEQHGGAIKNVRSFSQFDYQTYNGKTITGEIGRKCSLDGISNVLVVKSINEKKPKYTTQAESIEHVILNPGEGLSAVSLMKRFYKKSDEFPSTAEVALLDDLKNKELDITYLDLYKALFVEDKIMDTWFKLLLKPSMKLPELKDLVNWNYDFDFQYVYEENLIDKNFKNPAQFKALKQLQEKLSPYLKTKYYALVIFDGDHMGKWLSGEYLPHASDLSHFHNELSKSLSGFSNHAKTILDRNSGNGQTVFAGGDDFMGFVNIHHLFPLLTELRQQFDLMVNQQIPTTSNQRLTFSAGIVIAHYKTPFSEVLKQARAVEHKAKHAGDRNAFAITILKHSGEIQESVYKWGQTDDQGVYRDNWKALESIVKAIAPEDKGVSAFSNTFISQLTAELSRLSGSDLSKSNSSSRDYKQLNEAMKHEIKRLIKRSQILTDKKKEDAENLKQLVEAVQTLWGNALVDKKYQYFIHALQIADFITRKIKSS